MWCDVLASEMRACVRDVQGNLQKSGYNLCAKELLEIWYIDHHAFNVTLHSLQNQFAMLQAGTRTWHEWTRSYCLDNLSSGTVCLIANHCSCQTVPNDLLSTQAYLRCTNTACKRLKCVCWPCNSMQDASRRPDDSLVT